MLPPSSSFSSLLLLFYFFGYCCLLTSSQRTSSLKDDREQAALYKVCDRHLGSHFTKPEKTRICSDKDNDNNLTVSSLCASAVRKEFRNTPVDDIISLCSSTLPESLDHLTCLRAMTPSERVADGVQLCKFPTASPLSAACYKDLIVRNKNLKNNKSLYSREERDQIMLFCSTITSSHQVNCYQKSFLYGFGKNEHSIATVTDLCLPVTSEFMSDCLDELNPRIGWSMRNVAKMDQIKLILNQQTFEFCANVQSWSEVECYNNTLNTDSPQVLKALSDDRDKNKGSNDVNMNPRLQLCKGSNNAMGPIECIYELLHKMKGKNRERMSLSVCSGATSSAPAICYSGAPSGLKDELKLRLCQKTVNNGPSECFKSIRKVFSANQLDDEVIVTTCSRAPPSSPSGPSSCFINAPKYLSPLEKSLLCRESINSEPAQCMQYVESFSKLIMQQQNNDPQMKARLITLCAGDNHYRSMSPVKTAECMKSLHGKIGTDDGITLCTQIQLDSSSNDFFSYVPACLQHLNIERDSNNNGDWTFLHAALLCAPVLGDLITTAVDVPRIRQAVTCVHTTLKLLHFSKDEAVTLCRGSTQETENKLTCIKSAYKRHATGASAIPIDRGMVLQLCSESANIQNRNHTANNAKGSSYIAGECISQIASGYINDIPRLYLSWSAEIMKKFCGEASLHFDSRAELASRFNCIVSVSKSMVSSYDVSYCLEAPRYIESIKVISLHAQHNQITVTAGQWFSLNVKVYDNFMTPMSDLNDEFITLSINDQNSQGAVLWGRIINATINGSVRFNRLVITQPGDVHLYISASVNNEKKRVGSYLLPVAIDTSKKNPSICLFVFNEGMESVADFGNQYYIPFPSHFLWSFLSCLDLYDEWFVNFEISSDRVIIEYKLGIESIWTGRNFPSFSMSPYERLGLEHTNLPSSSKAAMKTIRKAYYQMSLKWHPDRWSSMPIYSVAVQQAFEMVGDAYKTLFEGDGTEEGEGVVKER